MDSESNNKTYHAVHKYHCSDIESNNKTHHAVNNSNCYDIDYRFNNTDILMMRLLVLMYTSILITLGALALSRTTVNEENEICPKSSMWYYIITSMILILLNNITTNLSMSGIFVECCNMSGLGAMIIMVVWGCTCLWSTPCVNELSSTLLFAVTQIYTFGSMIGFITYAYALYHIMQVRYNLCK